MDEQQYYVYILTNVRDTVFYTGITNDLKYRTWQHKTKAVPGFTSRYNVNKLVYYEIADTAYAAITREKQIKAGSRADKIKLIREFNPEWKDLYDSI